MLCCWSIYILHRLAYCKQAIRLCPRLCPYVGTSQIELTYTELNSNMTNDLKGGSLSEVLGA